MTAILINLLLAATLLSPTPHTLTEALQTKKIKVLSIHPGKHRDAQVLWLHIHNNTRTSLEVLIPAGQQFVPIDSNDQTLMLPEQRICKIKPGTKDSIPMRVFCCTASRRAPGNHAGFTVGKIHEPKMIQLLEYHKTHQITTDYEIQQSIWSVSDNHRVESIEGDSLRVFTAALTGQKLQPLKLKYIHESIPGRIAFEPKGLDVSGTFKFYTEKNIRADLKLFNQEEVLVTTLANNITGKSGQHTFKFHAFISKIQPGNYRIKLMHGPNTISEMPVTL
jgi:hypothetical protein